MKPIISFLLLLILSQQNLLATEGAAEITASFIHSIRNQDFPAYHGAFLPEMSASASPLALAYRHYEILELDKLGFEGKLFIEPLALDDENARLYCKELANVFLLNNKMERFTGGVTLCLNNHQWKVVYAEFSGNAPRL